MRSAIDARGPISDSICGPVRGLALLAALAIALTAGRAHAQFSYIDNGVIRLGVDTTRGGAIGHFSTSIDLFNVINTWDEGRYIQQSWYGDPDGSFWDTRPWRYNPVQGGNWQGEDGLVTAFTNDGTSIYTKTTPRHWANLDEPGGDDLLEEAQMEQWISLDGNVANIKFRMTYEGATQSAARGQELPAVFVNRSLKNLTYYDEASAGQAPWTGGATTTTEPVELVLGDGTGRQRPIDENWFSYTNDSGWGLGVYTPHADRITSYKVDLDQPNGTAYAAPIDNIQLVNNTVYEYDVQLTLGTVAQIRDRFDPNGPAGATNIIYQDDFDGGDGDNLFGAAPDVRPSNQTWMGSTGSFDADGSVDGEGDHGAWLPFAPVAGNVYQLSGSIDHTVNAGWITLGFAENAPDNHFNTTEADPYGTALVRQDAASSDVTFYPGKGLVGGSNHDTADEDFDVIDIILDATDPNSANWTVRLILDGTEVVGPTLAGEDGTFPNGDFGNIGYVGFSTNGGVGQLADFSLTIIPEPASMALLSLGGLLIAGRRRG